MIITKLKSNRGVTLIELLVASVIALIATGAALELYVSQQQGWIAQENITDMQQNGRAAVDELVYHIRQAGYHIPPALEAIYASNTNPDTITLVYLSEPICNAYMVDAMSSPSDDIECDPDSITCFEADTWAYIYDPITESGEFFLITEVQQASGLLKHGTMSLSKAYADSCHVYSIDVVTFFVDNTTDPDHPRLMIERADGIPQIYADNIEDLQLTYTLAHGAVVDTLISSQLVREVNIELVARTEREDEIADGFVRDTFVTSVFTRNLAF